MDMVLLKRIFLIVVYLVLHYCHLWSNTNGLYLSEKLVDSFIELDISNTSNFFIDLHATETKSLSRLILQEHLLKHDIKLVDVEQYADYLVTIITEENFLEKKTEKFPRVFELFIEMTFLVQITRKSDGQILDVRRYVYEEKYQEDSVIKSKWHTPFLTVFVMGSLVYLLFYGK